ncbi:MAG: DNA-formamidopyrimidine glycosylase [Planctomycetaceae bacterium]|nr:DNA-formamidopyrimidine glycosylase [Planctomycetaceae bacterium]
MPELPEVETMVRGIRTTILGSQLVSFSEYPCTRKPIVYTPAFSEISHRVSGTRLAKVYRKAKRVVLELDSQDSFVIEPRMTGLMLLEDAPTQDHLRCCWTLLKKRTEHQLSFWDRRGLGTVSLYSPEEFERKLGPDVIGPDALEMSEELWRERLSRTSREIKVALLDQKSVAGIGNLYASEILHRARISPFTKANTLTTRQIRALDQFCREILELAIRYEGSTLSDGTYRNALNKNGGYQNEHLVYGKTGELCTRCRKVEILRTVQAQRSTFYCPGCQKS